MFDARKRLYEMLGVDLTAIDGISVGVLTIASELGCDVSLPQREGVFGWLGLPNHKITGGKIKSRKTRPGANRSRLGCGWQRPVCCGRRRLSGRSDDGCEPGGFAESDHSDRHKLAKLVYRMLKYGEDYVRQGAEEYEAKYQERRLDALRRTAAALGFRLEPQAAQ